MEWIIKEPTALEPIAWKIIEEGRGQSIWLLEGPMGAGKTTLIKALAKDLGIIDRVQSPTYSIVHEYHTLQKKPIYHFDFYRITSEQEALDIGYEEYFYSGDLCLIEWAEQIKNLIPAEYFEIRLEVLADQSRKITTYLYPSYAEPGT